jgi:uncharacterized protein (DUF305 family)
MKTTSISITVLSLALASGCASAGAPGAEAAAPEAAPAAPPHPAERVAVAPADEAPVSIDRAYSEADVEFMQGMIEHHAQALEMVALVPERTDARGLRLLAERIEVSQRDEIALMANWLKARGEPVPATALEHMDPLATGGRTGVAGGHSPHHAPGALMPGMLTPEQMRRLEDASGDEFERLFLEFMIQHHVGALVMVAELFSTPGAGQEPEVFQFAAEVDSDQRMEIERMERMLREMESPAGP